MKMLVIARHGHRIGPLLTSAGQEAIEALAVKLRESLPEGTVLVLSSPVRAALESARLLASMFDAKPEVHSILESGGEKFEDVPGALRLIQKKFWLADILIVVTHKEYGAALPKYYLGRRGVVNKALGELDYAQAVVIDCLKLTARVVAP